MTRPDYRPPRPLRPRRGRLFRAIPVVAVVCVGAFLASRFAAKPDPQPLPVKRSLAAVKTRDLAQYTTDMAVGGGATAGVRAAGESKRLTASALTPADPEVVPSAAGVEVRGVRSVDPFVLPRDHAQAEAEAVGEARRLLAEKGYLPGRAAADTPLEVLASRDVPYPEELKPKLREAGLDEDRGWVEVDVKLTHDTLRAERAKGRTAEVGFWFGTAFLVLLAGYGFLRLDMWTKGYLTAAVGLVVAAVAVGGVLALGLVVLR